MKIPMQFFEELVALGDGLMRGQFMLAAYKNMDPLQHYLKKYVDLYKHIDDAEYLRQQERFASWYESPIDLPGRVYLQVVDQLFKQNQFVRGEYVALGKSSRWWTCIVRPICSRGRTISRLGSKFSTLKGTSARRRTRS